MQLFIQVHMDLAKCAHYFNKPTYAHAYLPMDSPTDKSNKSIVYSLVQLVNLMDIYVDGMRDG